VDIINYGENSHACIFCKLNQTKKVEGKNNGMYCNVNQSSIPKSQRLKPHLQVSGYH